MFGTMVLVLQEEDVARSVTMARAIEVVEQAARDLFSGQAQNAPRRRLKSAGRMLHILPAGSDRLAHMGAKLYLSGGQRTDFWYTLFDRDGLQALIAADTLGRIRTGAASAVATKLLARTEASVLAIIGAGSQAFTQIAAIAQVRSLAHVFVSSRSESHRIALADDVRVRLGVPATAVANAYDAVVAADIVVTVTSSREPVLEGAWLQPGTHINAVGSNKAEHREIDDDVLRRAGRIVVEDREQARIEAGDLLRASAFDWSRVELLSDLLGAPQPARDRHEITLFESLGIGLWDLALAVEIVQVAMNASP